MVLSVTLREVLEGVVVDSDASKECLEMEIEEDGLEEETAGGELSIRGGFFPPEGFQTVSSTCGSSL